MKTTNRYLAAMMALLVIAGVLFLTLNLAGPAFSKGTLASLIAPPAARRSDSARIALRPDLAQCDRCAECQRPD